MIRVVSLVPSVTETLLAWGVVPVGVTRFCTAPGVAKVGGTKTPDLAAVTAVEPDLVIMDQEENRIEDAQALEGAGVPLLVTRVRSLGDVAPALEALAAAVGTAPPVEVLPPPAGRRVRVWVPIWRRPWMTISGDTYGGSLLEHAGFENVFAGDQDPYPTVSVEDAARRRPQFALAPSEPYPFKEKHRDELEAVAPAVFADGQDLFWWGARTVAAVDRLSQLARELSHRQVSRRT